MKDQNNRANQYSQRESLVLLEPYLEPASIVEFLRHFNTLLPWIVAQGRIGMYGNQPVQRIVQGYIRRLLDMQAPNKDLQSIDREIDRLGHTFAELRMSLSDLENPIKFPESIEIQNHLDGLLVNMQGGDVGSVVSLFAILNEGLSGTHPQSEAIKKWFSTAWFTLNIDIEMPHSHMHSLIENGGSDFPKALVPFFDTFSDRCDEILSSRSDTSQEQYTLFLKYSARISQILGPLSTPIKRSPAPGMQTRKGNVALQGRLWRRV